MYNNRLLLQIKCLSINDKMFIVTRNMHTNMQYKYGIELGIGFIDKPEITTSCKICAQRNIWDAQNRTNIRCISIIIVLNIFVQLSAYFIFIKNPRKVNCWMPQKVGNRTKIFWWKHNGKFTNLWITYRKQTTSTNQQYGMC